MRIIFFFVIVLALLAAPPAGQAANDAIDFLNDDFYTDGQDDGERPRDLIEPFNRVMFSFNDTLYDYLFQPVTSVYQAAVPADLRGCAANFFLNLEAPIRFVNTLLQGRFADAGTVLLRFVVNTTFGVWGLGDPAASEFSIMPVDASMGETLGAWGIGDGFYLYVPFYGPSTLRDFSGQLVDGLVMAPYYMNIDDPWISLEIYSYKETNKMSFHLGEYEDLRVLTFDPYVSIRDAYFQYRKSSRNRSPQSPSPEQE